MRLFIILVEKCEESANIQRETEKFFNNPQRHNKLSITQPFSSISIYKHSTDSYAPQAY